jgi:PKD repeat protein
MQYRVTDGKTRKSWTDLINRASSRFDALLLVFLPVSLLLIFAMATLGMRRNNQQWLSINLMSRVTGNYSVDASETNKLPRINPQIIEAIKQDAQVVKNSLANVADYKAMPPPAVKPTPTSSLPVKELLVSAGGPYKGFEGSLISLVAEGAGSALSAVPGPIIYRWDLDNDGFYDDAKGGATSVIFFDEGEYTISIQATDSSGRMGTDTTIVSVSNVAPIVNIGETMFADEAEEILFLARVSDPGHDVLLYEWDFGDDSANVLDTLSPKHTYFDNGDYTVRLRVRDNDDGLTEASMIVHVMNLPPIIDAGPDRVVNESDLVIFNGSATDPAGDLDKLTYAWDLNYDGSTFTSDVLGLNASVAYSDGPATIVAALRVEDEDGGQTIDTVNVTVRNVAPTIASVTNNSPVGEGSPVTLQINATDVGSDTLTYAFDWNNDGTFDVENQTATASRTWYNQGNYTIGLQVTDDDDGQIFITTTVSVLNVPPTAVASGPSGARFEGSLVNFTGSGSSDPGIFDVLTYTWSFGDGSIANGIDVTHIYADNDVYSTTLTVMDDSGDSDTDSLLVTILNANPIAEIGPDRTVDEGIPITFDGNASDPGAADTLTYQWDFGDGSPLANDIIATHTYADGPATPVTYDVVLRVRDDDYPFPTGGGGQVGEYIDTLKVTVRNVPPVANSQGPYLGLETFPILLDGTATDPSPDDTLTLTYEWDLNNDGIFETPLQTVNYTWNTAGVYTITLRVTDDDGGVGLDTTQVTINNAPPTAEANGPYTTTVNLPVTLSGAGSADPTGDPLTYQWNFGDGTPVVITTNITVTHIYADDGIFTAILRVNDGRGGTGTDTATVIVNNLPPTAVASASLTTTLEGVPITFDGSGSSDPGLYDILSYQWNFGDGSPIATGITVMHAYPDNNIYTATLTVTDDGGMADTDTITNITILNANPVAEAGPDRIANEGVQISFDGNSSSDPGAADTLAFVWDFVYDGINFDEQATGVSVQITYLDGPATYDVALRVRDDDYPYPSGGGGEIGEHFDTLKVIVQNLPPIVDALGPYASIETVPLTLSGIAADVSLDTLTYEWDVDNDGTFDLIGQTVNNTWNTAGVYTITLRVTDDDGGAGFDTAQVTIDNAPPTADAGGPYITDVNLPVTLSAAGSTDPTGDLLTYQWDFGDGTPIIITNSVTVPHVYLDDDVYTATLQVDDGRGGTDTDVATVTVNNLPPIAIANANPTTTLESTAVTFDGSSSSDPGIYDTLTYQWDFGDGSPISTGINATHTYADDNVYTVVLTVTDDGGVIDTDTIPLVILNANPNAVASANPNPTLEGNAVTFDGSSSSDPGIYDTLTYQWDFGDGSPISTGINATHTYADDNIYTATLTVTDNGGAVDTDTIPITILNANPTAVASANPNPLLEGNPVTFDGSSSSDPGTDDTLTYEWDFDYDGLTFDVQGIGQNVITSYLDGPAVHTIALRVRDDDYPYPTGGGGEIGEDITTLQLTVNNAPPIASAGGPYITTVGISVTLTGSGSDVSADPLTYAWDLDNNGTFETPGQVVSYTNVMTTGIYTVGLQVDDGDGGVATDTTTVQVSLIVFAWPGVLYFPFRGKKVISLKKRKRRASNVAHKV